MIEIIRFKDKDYPAFHAKGFAAQYAFPFAKEVCKGTGFDIGCMKKEWSFPGSIPIDLSFEDGWHAMNLPDQKVDYIFSSHCLEHVPDWVGVLDYWLSRLSDSGTLFLYLPCYEEEYWRPWYNRKHVNILTPEHVSDWMRARGLSNIFSTQRDLYNSFTVMGQK